jgi:hypothetical protein
MTTPEDLRDDELYMELQEDVAEECNNYGAVKRVFIPRGVGGEEAGLIFVHFTQSEGAAKAKEKVRVIVRGRVRFNPNPMCIYPDPNPTTNPTTNFNPNLILRLLAEASMETSLEQLSSLKSYSTNRST